MIQHAVQLIRLGMDLKKRFGIDGLALMAEIRKIGDVQLLKKILLAVSKVSSAEDIRKLIHSSLAPQPPTVPPK